MPHLTLSLAQSISDLGKPVFAEEDTKKRWEQGDGNCGLLCLIPRKSNVRQWRCFSQTLGWWKWNLIWVQLTCCLCWNESQKCHWIPEMPWYGGYSVYTRCYKHSNLFFLKINCVLIPEPNCLSCCLWQNRPSIPQQGPVSVGVLSQVWLVGPCHHHWNVASHSSLLTSRHRKWQPVGPGSGRSGQV